MANKVYNDLKKTIFKAKVEEYPEYTFYFSSAFHRNKFLKEYQEYIKNENMKFNNRYKLKFEMSELFLLLFYRKCETRGFRVDYFDSLVLTDELEISIFFKGLL